MVRVIVRSLPAAGLLGLLLLLGACAGQEPSITAPDPDPATRVTTAEGELVGFVDVHGAHAWHGIPYARPPEGPLRWRAPLPPEARGAQTLQALTFGAACPQVASPLGGAPTDLTGQLWGEEDCLFLNVSAPARARADLPVMVWIHGGGNTVGHSGFYDGGPLAAAHDVIVVTLNYRLGPLGWLRHPALAGETAADASGNYGTLDIIRALEWVRDNIDAFGGDPHAVTVFGESAGATNVASLLVSPYAQNLFRGAIMQSGGTSSASAADASNYRDDPVAPGRRTSSAEVLLRIVTSDLDREGAACDRACARALVEAMPPAEQEALLRSLTVPDLFALYADQSGLLGPGSPTVIRDGSVLPEEPFIELFGDRERFHAVPMILGTNRDEPKIFMAFDPEQVVRIAGLPLWRRDARLYDLQAEYGALAWKLRGVDAPAERLHAAGIPVWTYRWDWDEQGRFAFVDLGALLGAAHGLEIPFVFGHFDVGPQSGLLFHDENAKGRLALSARMMAYWAGFARDLDPGRGADEAGPVWQSFDPDSAQTFLRLDTGSDGIRMDATRVDLSGLIERLSTDERFESGEERCAVFASSFRFDGSPDLIEATHSLGCTPPAR